MPEDRFNEYCQNLLVQYKRRNGKAVTRHLKGVCGILKQEGDVVQTKFGGSVQKGTYVTGLSDVDALLIVNQSSLKNKSPSKVIAYVGDTIQRRLPKNPVYKGKLAVTISYADKSEIQVLPAIRTKTGGFRIADPGSTKWSNVAHPERFAGRLIKVNNAKGGRVVPTIKFAKALADCWIRTPDLKISGYHTESLAIEAFKGYHGPLDPKSTLIHFLEHSMAAVKRPILDPTGQSKYVDGDLGPPDSKLRKQASMFFEQMRGKVKSCKTKAAFNALFCIGD